MFLIIFVIIIIMIIVIIIIIIIETIVIILKKNCQSRTTTILTSKKKDQVAQIGVGGTPGLPYSRIFSAFWAFHAKLPHLPWLIKISPGLQRWSIWSQRNPGGSWQSLSSKHALSGWLFLPAPTFVFIEKEEQHRKSAKLPWHHNIKPSFFRQGPRLSCWCWDECRNPLRAGVENVEAPKRVFWMPKF